MSLSRTNNGVLGVDGRVVAEREVASMSNPDEDTSLLVKRRIIKRKGTVGERKSRGYSSDGVIPEKSGGVASNSRDFNSLMIKGGSGGKPKIIWPQAKEWNPFPNDNKYKTTCNMLIPIYKREKRNEKVFTSVRVDT